MPKQTKEGKPISMLLVVNEFTRECVSIGVARQLNHDAVLERPAWLTALRGVPDRIQWDHSA